MESESVWRALASPHRRKILDLLREGPRTTGQLAKTMSDLSRFAVMQHLGVLEEAGLVLFRKEGRMRLNCVNAAPLREMYERWVDQYSSSAAETTLHFRRYAEHSKKEVPPKMEQSDYRLVKIELEIKINAPRERVFAAMTEEYDNWWPHRYKPDSTCYCDAKVGGYFGERFKNGGGAITGMIVYMDPPHVMMASSPSSLNKGTSSFAVDKFEEDGDGCIYKREMQIWGSVPAEMEQMFREGVRALMESALKGYLEDGKRYAAGV